MRARYHDPGLAPIKEGSKLDQTAKDRLIKV
jgi:hypothetical protein